MNGNEEDDEENLFNDNISNSLTIVDDTSNEDDILRNNNEIKRSWFSAVKEKINQFTGMAEWLMQLGASSKNNYNDDDVISELTEITSDGDSKNGEFLEDELKIVDDCNSILPDDFDNWLDLQKELISSTLKSNSFGDYQLQTFGPLNGLYPIGNNIKGEGHEFHPIKLFNPTWCDKCGDFIWELLLKQTVQCKYCQFTCHLKCSNLITLNCPNNNNLNNELNRLEEETAFWSMPSSNTISIDGYTNGDLIDFSDCTEENIKDKIIKEIVNEPVTIKNEIVIPNEEKVNIQVIFNFRRPINIIERTNETIQLGTGSPTLLTGTITSIYVPKNTPKNVSIKANVKISRFILLLLSKLKIADNPKKFAFYIKYENGKMIKIDDEDNIGDVKRKIDKDGKSVDFVLQENDTGGIIWESFELPELENFLKILDLQEECQRQQLIEQQRIYAFYLDMELKSRGVNLSELEK
ncbi:Ras-association domain and Protein kinase C-like, phorbol ester/diacylglycerol binding domain and SARAH domain-containing protein [Strongyloides ratti]|uniref:Ras-association domain and Protein kinase C-like, phorbol ester/diacylglycerol binding domain and SARAH domain-containing protein n=1 Tax=Strongyloides ratti TaxID=34506 RepID=A0A090LMI0_STRRB|nr:Ras-association domain and Protein kinase C-like, phorbol ester/diacylglycerol binding domain and SARAH domain-containing protein [Strongyloides ratti]CEF70946.1 Ras-association domain and Protein kinase C-like, phorbol ester/diacylglycerol binding domain and SARAH domain-containing protein [Strongyloides ratti]